MLQDVSGRVLPVASPCPGLRAPGPGVPGGAQRYQRSRPGDPVEDREDLRADARLQAGDPVRGSFFFPGAFFRLTENAKQSHRHQTPFYTLQCVSSLKPITNGRLRL